MAKIQNCYAKFAQLPVAGLSLLYDPFCPNGSRLRPFGPNGWRFWKCAGKAPRAEGAKGRKPPGINGF